MNKRRNSIDRRRQKWEIGKWGNEETGENGGGKVRIWKWGGWSHRGTRDEQEQ